MSTAQHLTLVSEDTTHAHPAGPLAGTGPWLVRTYHSTLSPADTATELRQVLGRAGYRVDVHPGQYGLEFLTEKPHQTLGFTGEITVDPKGQATLEITAG